LASGLALLFKMLLNAIENPAFTFRPSRARILIALGLAALLPRGVVLGLPFTFGGLALYATAQSFDDFISHLVPFLVASAAAYPIAAMIAQHSVNRRWLRIGMIALIFLSAYSAHLLWTGQP
jgi:hypothetical protein